MYLMRIEIAGHVIEAHSVGGIETSFQVPSFDCNLDIGRCPPAALRRSRLFLTHAHMDHAAGLPYFVSMRAMQNLPPPKVYCPQGIHANLSQILALWTQLDSSANRCELIGVNPGDRFALGGDRYMEAFRSPHRVETLGFCLIRQRKKLKPAYYGLNGKAIAEQVRLGQEVHESDETPEICFPGDTNITVVENEILVRTSRLLMLECTFIGDKPGQRWAHKGGHIHLDDIAERADLFQNEAILLTHFSRRYAPDIIRKAVQDRLPKRLKERIHLLIHEPL